MAESTLLAQQAQDYQQEQQEQQERPQGVQEHPQYCQQGHEEQQCHYRYRYQWYCQQQEKRYAH